MYTRSYEQPFENVTDYAGVVVAQKPKYIPECRCHCKYKEYQPQGFYDHFIHKVVNMLNNGMNPIIHINGDPGTGKSIAALWLAKYLYNRIDLFQDDLTPDKVQDILHYRVLPFLYAIDDIDMPDQENSESVNYDRELFIFDEASTKLNSKDNWSDFNRSVDEVIQTQRVKNCIYIFISPHLSDVDKSIRDQVDFSVRCFEKGKAAVTQMSKRSDSLKDDRRWTRMKGFTWTDPDNWSKEDKKLVEAYRDKEEATKEGIVEERINQLEEKRKEEKRKAAGGKYTS